MKNLIYSHSVHFILAILNLNLIGILNLYSVSDPQHAHLSSIVSSQLTWLCLAWVGYFAVVLVGHNLILKYIYWLYALNLGALALVMVYGKTLHGATRWLDLGFFKYQPSESMKLMAVLVVCRLLADFEPYKQLGFKQLFKPAVFLMVPFFLIVKQPDLGTALLLVLISASVVLFVGVKKEVILSLMACVVLATPVAWKFGLKDYQKKRVISFLSLEQDPLGMGYNSMQSRIAIGSGRLWGKGFKQGTQSQLQFLPERHTDFIFSVMGEEHGFVGSSYVLISFLLLLFLSLKTTRYANNRCEFFMILGSSALLFWHVLVNLAMTMELLPVVGVPLSLISYGGSNMLTTMTAMGLIASVTYRRRLF